MILNNTESERRAAKRAAAVVAPPPDLSLSEWADRFRYLSSESSPEPGRWVTERIPYQREPLDCGADPAVEKLVLMWASQTGKTEILNNSCGYYIDQDPSPILVVQPTLEMGEAWSKDRLAPMIRDCPVLARKVNSDLSRDGKNTVRHKSFTGGHITIAGANSPASLASRPIRVLILDEIDRFTRSAGKEGDPKKLATKRTANFWNRKIVMASSPTTKGNSPIAEEYEQSDKRRYHVPCPHCGEMQLLQWSQVQWPEDVPELAYYVCAPNGCIIHDSDKMDMLRRGVWIAEAPFRGVAGFWISSIYSPWVTFGQLAKTFIAAKALPETLKVFVNTELAELWEEDQDGEGIDEQGLAAHCSRYIAAPERVLVITAGVDIQNDRIELEVLGWGVDKESWSLDYKVLHGDPGRKEVWQALDDELETMRRHAGGFDMPIHCVAIDSGGHHTDEVYVYCKKKQKAGKRIFPIKGASTAGRPIIGKPSRNNKHKVKMFIVGTDTAKDTIFSHLKIETPGAGYCHFPVWYEDDYFLQLTSEKVVQRYERGKTTRKYVKKAESRRNEVLDCRVYNHAAFAILNPNLSKIAERVAAKSEKNLPPETMKATDTVEEAVKHTASERLKHSRSTKRGKGKGFVKSW